jgi:hypothetical protein
MKTTLIAFAALGLAVAGSAAASGHVTDVDYLKASRCKGLATVTGADTAGLDAFIKSERGARQSVVLRMADEQVERGKHDAGNANLKDKVTAELAGACAAYSGPAKASLAAQ